MKTEDIDKRISMPDVDKEWARFEQEVIGKETKRHSALAWALGIGIAASVALFIIYNIGKEQTEEPLVAQVQPAHSEHVSELARVPAKEVVAEVSKPVATPRKELALAKADAPATTGLDIPAREYTGAVQKIKMDDMGDLAFESVDQALQGQIAGQDISHNEAEPELQGVIAGHEGIDPTYNDSILVLLDGKRLPDSLCTRQFARRGIHKYLEKKGLLVDKIVRLNEESVRIKGDEQTKQRYKQYVEQYGRLAQLGVAEITSANDSANEVFVLQHPELKKTFRRVEGFVMEESTNEPLESTIIRHRQFATSADPLGHFVLWVPKSVDTLYAKCIGCQDAFFQPADTTLTIRLKDNYRSHDIASADLSSGTTMRLRGIGYNKIDSFLVVVNGKTLFDSRGMTSEETERRLEEYLNEQGLLQDIKIPWKNGAIEIYASTPEEREERQRMIANATIVPTSADLGSGTTMRLRGTGESKPDSFLVAVNGKTLFDSRGMTSEEIEKRIEEYLNEQGLLQDIKIPCNNGAIVIMASTPEKREELQRMIANLTIVPKPPHLGSGTLRLIGTGDGPSDKDRIDSTLILVNGEPLPDSLKHKIMGNDMDDIDTYMPRYFSQQGLMIDSVYVHKDSKFTAKYGGLAKYGVIEITTVPGAQEELLAALPDFVPDENEVRLLPQGVIGGSHDSTPNDSILYLVNGEPQPKENNKWLGRRSYLDYFKGQHLLVSKVMRHMNEEAKQRYIEKYGEAAKHGVIEYICVEDTLCDYYMDQHEELKASRRRVSGIVYDENDEPLAHTIIYIWHEKRVWGFETTDSLGNFTFWVPRTDVKMEFTYVGFYKAVVVEPSDTFQTIYLLPNDNLKSLRESLKF